MRAAVCIIAAVLGFIAQPAPVRAEEPGAAAFWKAVQARCDATAKKPASALGKRIAQTAIDEFTRFNGHRIDSNGRLFHYGLNEAEHAAEHAGERPTRVGELAWWRVMKYWHALYGDAIGDKLEVRGYRGASTATDETQTAELLPLDVGDLLRAADNVADADQREVLREAILRAAIIDTPWSAAFISYVVKQAGAAPAAFQFSNAHRAYIYDAFAASAAEATDTAGEKLYRACPLATTIPRAGDLICFQREHTLADASEEAVRERIRAEVASGDPDKRTVRSTHCDVVAAIDAPARKMYVIGGNFLDGVTAKKLSLRRSLKFSGMQKGHCGGPGAWTLPPPSAGTPAEPALPETCSLSDKKWFVLLQMR
jgi:Uncharacterized protein conserved in bacteria (DUF2272)